MRTLFLAIIAIGITTSIYAIDINPLSCFSLETPEEISLHLLGQGFKVNEAAGNKGCDKRALRASHEYNLLEVQFKNGKLSYIEWYTDHGVEFMKVKEFFEDKGERKGPYLIIEETGNKITCAAWNPSLRRPILYLVAGDRESNKVGFKQLDKKMGSSWDSAENFSYPPEDFMLLREQIISDFPSNDIHPRAYREQRITEADASEKDDSKVSERTPIFCGCEDSSSPEEIQQCTNMAIVKWLVNNIRYPEWCKKSDVGGTVFIRFVVDYEGNVKDLEVMRSVNEDLDNEALRVLKALPVFIPGVQNGERVNVEYVIPVKFAIG